MRDGYQDSEIRGRGWLQITKAPKRVPPTPKTPSASANTKPQKYLTLLVEPTILQDEIHYRLDGFGQYDGLYPGGKHRETWPHGCDESFCPQYNPCVVPPRPGYERQRFNIALQSVRAYLKGALLIASYSWGSELARAQTRWRLDDAAKVWSGYLKERQVED